MIYQQRHVITSNMTQKIKLLITIIIALLFPNL